MVAKMRYCCVCGDEIGVCEDKDYDRRDTCSKQECNREMRDAYAAERAEAHERLDRDMGWD
jgi:hypothetical protein